MSAVVDALLAAEGLDALDTARAKADLAAVRAGLDRLRRADLLAVGALADRVRAREVGDAVRLYVDRAAPVGAIVVGAGPDLLREVAIARVTSPRGARVRVDWNEVGLELAQIALGFGADELTGRLRPPRTRKGLPLADGERLRRDELARLVECAQRRAVFVEKDEETHVGLA